MVTFWRLYDLKKLQPSLVFCFKYVLKHDPNLPIYDSSTPVSTALRLPEMLINWLYHLVIIHYLLLVSCPYLSAGIESRVHHNNHPFAKNLNFLVPLFLCTHLPHPTPESTLQSTFSVPVHKQLDGC